MSATPTELVLPQLGETVTEGTITRWFKGPGDTIAIGEMLYEVSTDKVDSEVPSPLAGTIAEIRVPEGETIDVGTVLALVDATDGAIDSPAGAPTDGNADVAAPSLPAVAVAPDERQSGSAPDAAPAQLSPAVPAEPPEPSESPEAAVSTEADAAAAGRLLSPVVRRLVRKHGLDPAAIKGTGVGGRITRSDVLDAIDERELGAGPEPGPSSGTQTGPSQTGPSHPSASPAAGPPAAGSPISRTAPTPQPDAVEWTDGNSRLEPFNNIRRRTGEHMVHSMATSPHALTVVEVDYENVEQVRRAERDQWRAAEGFSLTYLPFIVVAVADALAHWPRLNASVEEGGLRIWRRLNVGVAVDLNYEGLIVPVLRDVDSLSLRGVARAMNELAGRARERRLSPDDISGGTFTISNNGSFGTYTTAAIINQPQVAVLSTDGVTRRPVVVTDQLGNEAIAVHSVGHLAMGWDHRAFDGSYAAGFLGHIRQMLQSHDWSAEL